MSRFGFGKVHTDPSTLSSSPHLFSRGITTSEGVQPLHISPLSPRKSYTSYNVASTSLSDENQAHHTTIPIITLSNTVRGDGKENSTRIRQKQVKNSYTCTSSPSSSPSPRVAVSFSSPVLPPSGRNKTFISRNINGIIVNEKNSPEAMKSSVCALSPRQQHNSNPSAQNKLNTNSDDFLDISIPIDPTFISSIAHSSKQLYQKSPSLRSSGKGDADLLGTIPQHPVLTSCQSFNISLEVEKEVSPSLSTRSYAGSMLTSQPEVGNRQRSFSANNPQQQENTQLCISSPVTSKATIKPQLKRSMSLNVKSPHQRSHNLFSISSSTIVYDKNNTNGFSKDKWMKENLTVRQSLVSELNKLGSQCFREGKFSDAMKVYQKALTTIRLEVKTNDSSFLTNSSEEKKIDFCDRSVDCSFESSETWSLSGDDNSEKRESKNDEPPTENCFRMGIILMSQTLNNMCTILWRIGDNKLALATMKEAQYVQNIARSHFGSNIVNNSTDQNTIISSINHNLGYSGSASIMGRKQQNNKYFSKGADSRYSHAICVALERCEANTLLNFGIVYYFTGKSAPAIKCLTNALKIISSVSSRASEEKYQSNATNIGRHTDSSNACQEDDLTAARIVSIIGNVYAQQGIHQKAEKLHEDVLRIKRGAQLHNQGHRGNAIVITLHNQAYLHLNNGELGKAMKLYHQILKIQQGPNKNNKKNGQNHNIEVAITMHFIGQTHAAKNENKEALKMYRAVLKMYNSFSFSYHHKAKAALLQEMNNIEMQLEGKHFDKIILDKSMQKKKYQTNQRENIHSSYVNLGRSERIITGELLQPPLHTDSPQKKLRMKKKMLLSLRRAESLGL